MCLWMMSPKAAGCSCGVLGAEGCSRPGPFPALVIIPWAMGATMTTLLTALPGCRQIGGQTCSSAAD